MYKVFGTKSIHTSKVSDHYKHCFKILIFKNELCVHHSTKGKDQRTTCRNQVSLSATWIPRIKVRSSGSVAIPLLLHCLPGPSYHHFIHLLLVEFYQVPSLCKAL